MTSHRGLSAVVGTVFLVAVVVGALSYVSYSLDVMGNYSQSLIVEESRQRDKQSEAFEISSIDITASDKLDGIIKNTGEIPVKITTLYIDEQGVNDVVQKFDLDAEIAPGNTADLSSLVDFTMDVDKGYNMKVVSSRGEINSFYVNSLADENVYMSLTPNPSVIPSTFESTLLFTVVNNMSNGNYLYNLVPVMDVSEQDLVETSAGLSNSLISGPIPTSYDSLGPGEVAIFTYSYELTGDTVGDKQIFNATLTNANTGNFATTSVSIKEVPIATDAGSALTSLGLTESDSVLTDVLFFHIDTSLTPNAEYGMDGSSPNSAGLTLSPNGNTLEFISAPMTASTSLPIGTFNASLNYFSNAVPLGFPEPTFAFMMDSKDCGNGQRICDVMGTVDNDKGMKEEEGDPRFSGDFDSGGGPHGDNYFRSDPDTYGDQWFQDDGEFDNVEQNYAPDTIAVWVRIPDISENLGADVRGQPLVAFGEDPCYDPGNDCPDSDGSDEDIFGLFVGTGGEIEFKYSPDRHNKIVDCVTPTAYDTNEWIHIVGVRDAAWSCKLYINGTLVVSDTDTYSGDSSVDPDFNAIFAKNSDGEPDAKADIASYLFWDNAALDADQVNDLYYTNYGNNGTRLYMTVERTDEDGVWIEDVVLEKKIVLPFHDPTINQDDSDPTNWLSLQTHNFTDNDEDSELKYSQANMTAASTSVIDFDIGDRIKIILDWKDEDESNLPINITFDNDFGGFFNVPDGPSFFQTPPPTPRWPTFLSFSYDEEINYLAYNEGPGGIWFVYAGTRLVLTSNDGLTSYAAVPYTVNATTQPTPIADYSEITPYQDSIYIPAEYYAEIDFYQLQSPPSPDSAPKAENTVPTGDYDGALYLQGYDESGETFKKTIDLGLIHIYGNP
ncbi:LamG-like jellyroll fold domain-containing protein [Nitrosopumilus sp.]|uniref:LamG-like jellyroll fold domain-containing protein n=1 Tax=Nitrosopumilus sp. TaxID=2024843 RepID=UPI00247D36F0|nr:LamG-like jellyroll fold domain-containing protein [Nitrosopumilus sp.]MCV0430090.1 LamG domain-containing protein [Nitrosopumilus sp.]